MVRRTVAVGLVAIFAVLAASPWLACGGWQSTAAARHACCDTIGQACPHPPSGDDACCALKESTNHQRQAEHGYVDGTIALLPSSLDAVLHTWIVPDPGAAFHRVDSHSPHVDSALYLRYALLRV